MIYVLLSLAYVFVGVLIVAYCNGRNANGVYFEPIDTLLIVFWPLIAITALVHRPINFVYKTLYNLGKRDAKRAKERSKRTENQNY